jgi:[ribosomal protein S18]-alanine N-acetyltransferase
MVTRSSLTIVVDRMTVDDLSAVHEIERESFSTPWPPHAYLQELESNKLAHYLVARYGDRIVGFAGTWLLVDEAHVTTFATRATWRRQGVGERLLIALLDKALARGANEATLEVRPTNMPARRLYEKFGFKVVGVRPRYYTDNNEDALIMTTEPLEGRPMKERLARLRAEVAARPEIELGDDGLPLPSAQRPEAGPEAAAAAADAQAEADAEAGRAPRVIRPSSVSRRSH